MRDKLIEFWDTKKPEACFLIIASVMGLLFAFITPPTQVGDETTHFYRAYELSEGHLYSKHIELGYGDFLPREVQNTTVKLFNNMPSHPEVKFNYHQIPVFLKKKINNKDLVPVHLEGATVYTPVGYIPQIAAIYICKVVWPSPILMYYVGRILNLVVWMLLIYVAMRLWPLNKWIIFALALTPMSLSMAASFSQDALTNGLAFVVIAGILNVVVGRKKLTNKQAGAFSLAIVLLSLCKPIFFPLILLTLLIRRDVLGSKVKYWTSLGLLSVVTVGLTAAWSLSVRQYTHAIQYYYLYGANIHEPQQAHFVLSHPLNFLSVLIRTYFSNISDVVYRTFIGRLGWWEIDLPIWMIIFTYTLIFAAVFIRDPEDAPVLKKIHRQLSFLTYVAIALIMSGILYLTVTEVGADYVHGLQGRYFIAISPLLAVPFSGILTSKDWNNKAAKILPLSYIFLLSTSLIIILNRFI